MRVYIILHNCFYKIVVHINCFLTLTIDKIHYGVTVIYKVDKYACDAVWM